MNSYQYLVFNETKKFQIEVKKEKNYHCYLALQAASLRNFNEAQFHLENINKELLTEIENAIILEAKALLSYATGNFIATKLLAEQAIALNDNLFFSRSLLAKLAEFDKNYSLAMSYYKHILKIYPDHSTTQLNVVQIMLILKNDYGSIMQLVLKSQSSFRQFMYLILIPIGKPAVRTLALLLIFLLLISQWGELIFWSLLTFFFLILIYSLIKLKWDSLVVTRIIFIQIIIIVAQFLVSIVRLF